LWSHWTLSNSEAGPKGFGLV